MKTTSQIKCYLKNLRNTKASPGFGVPQGVQAFTTVFLGLLTSFGLGFLANDSAYAAYSASISRTSSGTITLSDSSGGSIKPSSSGTLGTGSDVVTVSSNCSAGYNLYVSAISGGSTSLSTSGGLDYIPSTTTATGSEAALTKDTWGIGKDGTTFSRLQSYSEDLSTMSPLYTGTGSISSPNKEYTIYYGVNVSTAKTPGTYTGDVLYTVLMNSACEKFTLSYDGNGATTNNLSSEELAFDVIIDLSVISSTDKIAKTGYHLSGWQDQDGNSYGITGEADINPNDLTTVTLTAIWTANTYTIKYAAGSTGGTCSVPDTSATYDQDVTLSSTKCAKTNYDQTGWSINQDGSTKDYTLGETLTKPNLTSENNGSITLYPYFESTFGSNTMQGFSCTSLSYGGTKTLTDVRDNNTYTVLRLSNDNSAGAIAGKCLMTENLKFGYSLLKNKTDGDTVIVNPTTSNYETATSTGDSSVDNSGDITLTYKKGSWSNVNSYSTRIFTYADTGTTYTYNTNGYYSWGAALVVCPRGWRLPTNDEMLGLISLTGSSSSTEVLRGNTYKFPTYGGWYYGSFQYLTNSAFYWTSTNCSDSTYAYQMLYGSSGARTRCDWSHKRDGFMTRCVAD